MRATLHALLLGTIAGASIGLISRPALAQTDITRDEYICASNAAKTFGRFIVKKSTCVQACIANRRRTFGPFTDCFAPFGGATAACVFDSRSGAEPRARASIVRRCRADCPECFAPSACTDGEPFVTNVENQLDLFSQFFVYCIEGGGGIAPPAHATCEDAVSRAVVKLGETRIRCYTRCFAKALGRSCPTCTSGQIPEADCHPPASDPSTAACLARGEAKAIQAIDASCSALGANPACYLTNGFGPFDTGASWVSFFGGAIDGQVQNLACGG